MGHTSGLHRSHRVPIYPRWGYHPELSSVATVDAKRVVATADAERVVTTADAKRVVATADTDRVRDRDTLALSQRPIVPLHKYMYVWVVLNIFNYTRWASL